MAEALSPFNPSTMAVALGWGRTYVLMYPVTLDAGEDLSVTFTPDKGLAWVLTKVEMETPRNAATGADIRSTSLYAVLTHQPSIRPWTVYGLGALSRWSWPVQSILRGGEGLVVSFHNGLTVQVNWGIVLTLLEIGEGDVVKIRRLWQGLYNLLHFLGGFDPAKLDVEMTKEFPKVRLPDLMFDPQKFREMWG